MFHVGVLVVPVIPQTGLPGGVNPAAAAAAAKKAAKLPGLDRHKHTPTSSEDSPHFRSHSLTVI